MVPSIKWMYNEFMKVIGIFITVLVISVITSFFISVKCHTLANFQKFIFQNNSQLSFNIASCNPPFHKQPLKGVCRPGNSCIN